VPAKISVEKLQEGLRTKRLGKRILFTHEVDSTNEWAKELAKLDTEEGTVAIAETQTAGHGRLGRDWFSPKGGLWFSVVLRPKLRASETVGLVFAAGLAAAEALHEKYDLPAETMWPNDVLVHGRKICGILCEMNTTGETVNFGIVGVGINVNFDVRKVLPRPLQDVATSVQNELGKKVPLEELLRLMLEKLEIIYDLYVKEGLASVLEKWKKHASFIGHTVHVAYEDERLLGVALDVDSEGALVLRLEDGTLRRFLSGNVSLEQGQ
jgi:BirA family biotin operon repressor/biotin-[acetyl-CoA-carboxylase] ligase